MFAFGLPKFGWLKKLVAVIRTWNLARSVTWKYLNSPKSTFARPGPTITLRALLPKRPLGGTAKAAALNHWKMDWLDDAASPTRSGRPPCVRVLDTSVLAKVGVRNWPVWNTVTRLNCQFPSRWLAAAGMLAPWLLPAPNGISYEACATKRCRGVQEISAISRTPRHRFVAQA